MQDLRQAIHLLVSGYPKQATSTIQKLNTIDPQFYRHLAALITGQQTQQLKGKCLTAAIVTLNTFAIRSMQKKSAKDFLVVQEIYSNIKYILGHRAVVFESKKYLSQALASLWFDACSTHSQVLEIKSFIKQADDKQSVLIALNTIAESKTLVRNIQVECIVQLFDLALNQICYYKSVPLQLHQNQGRSNIQIMRNGWIEEVDNLSIIKRLAFIIDTLHYIFVHVFKTITQPYEHEALQLLTSQVELTDILFSIIYWTHPCQTDGLGYMFPWFSDIIVPGLATIQSHKINNLKQKSFQILSSILSKSSPQINFHLTSHCLLQKVPHLCKQIIQQVVLMSKQFISLDHDYLIGAIFDSMLLFLAHALNLPDLGIIFAEGVTKQGLLATVIGYLDARQVDVGVEDEEFGDFLEGFMGGVDTYQMSRYAITTFISACCKKMDWFPYNLFCTCYNSLLNKLQQKFQSELISKRSLETPKIMLQQNGKMTTQNVYKQLYLPIQKQLLTNGTGDTFSIGNNLIVKNIQVCITGLLCLHKQIQSREDFQHAIVQLLLTLDFQHFQQHQKVLLFFFATKNCNLFLSSSLIHDVNRYIRYAIELADKQAECANIFYSFIEQMYKACQQRSISQESSNKYVQIVSTIILPSLLQKQATGITYNQQFYSLLMNVVSFPKELQLGTQDQILMVGGKKYRKQIQTVGDYILTQIGSFMFRLLKLICANIKHLLTQKHQQILALRMFQLVALCIQNFWVLSSLRMTGNEVSTQIFSDYAQVVQQMVVGIMEWVQHQQSSQAQITIQQILNLIELLSILIRQQHCLHPQLKSSSSAIGQQMFTYLLPVLLAHPYGEHWLTCICEFVHRIQSKFDINQQQSLTTLIKKSYETVSSNNNELKINEISLLSMVLLNYEQPQNWFPIHQIIRVKLVKLAYQSKQMNIKNMNAVLVASESFEFGITIIRMFHVYLFGWRMEPHHQVLSELLDLVYQFVQKYTLVQAAHLILATRSSFTSLTQDNFNTLIDIILLVLNKLIRNEQYYGNETIQETRIRKLSQKIGCISADPYQQLRSLVLMAQKHGLDLSAHDRHGANIKSMMSVSTCKGQPRKLYSIRKAKA